MTNISSEDGKVIIECGNAFWEQLDSVFMDYNFDDYEIFEILSEQKNSIEEYFQKPLGQVFKEHGYSGVIEAYNRDALKWGEATIQRAKLWLDIMDMLK